MNFILYDEINIISTYLYNFKPDCITKNPILNPDISNVKASDTSARKEFGPCFESRIMEDNVELPQP